MPLNKENKPNQTKPEVMVDKDGWWETVKELFAISTTW